MVARGPKPVTPNARDARLRILWQTPCRIDSPPRDPCAPSISRFFRGRGRTGPNSVDGLGKPRHVQHLHAQLQIDMGANQRLKRVVDGLELVLAVLGAL